MAVRKPRRPAAARRARARAATKTRTRTAGKGKSTRKTVAARRRSAPRSTSPNRRRQEPETLRLRSIDPSLTVGDLDRSIRFYTDVLGFFLAERWVEGNALRGVLLKAGSCRLALTQDDWSHGRDRQKGEGLRLWCRTVQDLDTLAARIEARGGRLTDGPVVRSWGARSFSVADPDGFGLTFYHEP